MDAVTHLLAQLAGVYAPLGEEQRMQAMTELQPRDLPTATDEQLLGRLVWGAVRVLLGCGDGVGK